MVIMRSYQCIASPWCAVDISIERRRLCRHQLNRMRLAQECREDAKDILFTEFLARIQQHQTECHCAPALRASAPCLLRNRIQSLRSCLPPRLHGNLDLESLHYHTTFCIHWGMMLVCIFIILALNSRSPDNRGRAFAELIGYYFSN